MLPLFKVFMNRDVDESLGNVLHSGSITQGKKVEEFEQALSSWFGYPYILTLNSATSGLTLALRLLNLEKDDEVLSTPLTCTATNFPILANGLCIKWLDVDPETCNIDLDRLSEKITEKTKALMLVHWAGTPVDLNRLETILDEAEEKYGHRIRVIEDCAHAFGASYGDKKIGTTHEHICVFSLQAIKHLTTGDGGLIFLPNKEIYERAKKLRWFGIDREKRSRPGKDFRLESDISEWGYKYHMNDINATIGLANLPYIADLLKIARDNAKFYRENLENVPGITLLKSVPNTESSFWIFTLKVANKKTFTEFMTTKEIMVSQVHNRNDIYSCLDKFKCDLPQLDSLEKHIISIPVGWWVTEKDRLYVVNSIREWSEKYYKIRNLQITDKDILQNLISQLAGYRRPMGDEEWEKVFERLDHTGLNILIESDGVAVAYGRLLVEPKLYDPLGHIEDVVVNSEYRGKWYGKIVIETLVRLSKEKGCYKTVLDCLPKNIAFYKVCGFSKEGSEMVLRNN